MIFEAKMLTVYVMLGGGIVFDSDPYDEYIETMNKLRASMTSLQNAEERYLKEQTMGAKPILTPYPTKKKEQQDGYFT
jgi:anthranilate synthase component 1